MNYKRIKDEEFAILIGAEIIKLGGKLTKLDSLASGNYYRYYLEAKLWSGKYEIRVTSIDRGEIVFLSLSNNGVVNNFMNITIKTIEEFIRLLEQLQIIREKE